MATRFTDTADYSPEERRVIVGGLVILGAILVAIFCAVLVNAISAHLFDARAVHATGRVVEVTGERGGRGGMTYTSVVEYRANDGVEYRRTTSAFSPERIMRADSVVPLRYDADTPADARFNVPGDADVALAMATMIVSLMLIVIWSGVRREPRRR